MSAPLSRRDQHKKINSLRSDVGRLQRSPLVGEWQYPVALADANPTANPYEVYLQNGWKQPTGGLPRHRYRWNMNGDLEFEHPLVPGTYGSPAYRLPGLLADVPEYRPDDDKTFFADVQATVGSQVYQQARWEVDSATGDVTINPITAGALPYAGLTAGNQISPYSLPPAGASFATIFDYFATLGGDTDANQIAIYDDEVYAIFPGTSGGRGSIFLNTVGGGVFLFTANVYFDVDATDIMVGLTFPDTVFASQGAGTFVPGPTSVAQCTEHRLVGGEGSNEFTVFVSHGSGANRDVIAVALEVTRLVDQTTIDGLATFP